MDVKYIKDNYVFETLDENHKLDDFECESKDLTDFLKNDALKQQDMNLNLTKVVICDDVVVGYVSLLTDVIKLKVVDDKNIKEKIRDELDIMDNHELPAIKIGRFEIDIKYAKQTLGSDVLANVILFLLNISNN